MSLPDVSLTVSDFTDCTWEIDIANSNTMEGYTYRNIFFV